MQIDANILAKYLRVATLNGAIDMLQLKGMENGLFSGHHASGIAFSITTLKKDAFFNYSSGETIKIRDADRFNNIIKSFKGKIELGLKDPYITIRSEGRTAHVKLAEIITNIKEEINPDAEKQFDNGFNISAAILQQIERNNNTIKANIVRISVKDNILTFTSIADEDHIEEKIEGITYKDFTMDFQTDWTSKVFPLLEADKINIAILPTKAMRIIEDTKAMNTKILLAPSIKTE